MPKRSGFKSSIQEFLTKSNDEILSELTKFQEDEFKLGITSGTARQVLLSPSSLVRFIKSLFLKEIILLRDVDTGERTVEYLLQKQLKLQAPSSIETYRESIYD